MSRETPLSIQLRVLFALLVREMTTRFGRSAGGYVWALLEPAGTVALLSLVFSAIAHRPAVGDSFPIFFATAYMAFHVYMDVSRNVSLAVQVNRPLLTFPRVTPLDAILARFILQVLTAVTVSAIILGGLILALDDQIALRLDRVFLAMGLAAALGLAVGMLNCVLFAYSPTWERAFGILNRPLFLISGIFFTYEGLPRPLQELIWWNPLVHVTAIMRSGFYPTYDAAFAEPLFVAAFAAVPLTLGGLLLRALRARMLEP